MPMGGGHTTIVQAAGGVVTREGPGGRKQVLVVHRPRYDDWTLPKGKLLPGESHAAGALREVEEETGLRCTLGRELASTAYIDARGRRKQVRYWQMQAVDGAFSPTGEVDDIRWVPLADAAGVLSYERDAAVVASLFTCGSTRGSPR